MLEPRKPWPFNLIYPSLRPHAQVLGVSVDTNNANKAWAEEMGVTYPFLSDVRRQMTRAYGVLCDDPKMARTQHIRSLLASQARLVRDR